jgi:hypothetical protein
LRPGRGVFLFWGCSDKGAAADRVWAGPPKDAKEQLTCWTNFLTD